MVFEVFLLRFLEFFIFIDLIKYWQGWGLGGFWVVCIKMLVKHGKYVLNTAFLYDQSNQVCIKSGTLTYNQLWNQSSVYLIKSLGQRKYKVVVSYQPWPGFPVGFFLWGLWGFVLFGFIKGWWDWGFLGFLLGVDG